MEVFFESGFLTVIVRLNEDTVIDIAKEIAKDGGVDVTDWDAEINH